MSTSGVTTFSPTAAQIISAAYRKLGVIDEDNPPSTNQYTNAIFQLNTMLKAFHSDGMPLWAIKETAIPCSSFTNGSLSIGIGQVLSIPSPLKVTQAYFRDSSSSIATDIPMWPITRYNYNMLATKRQVGRPINYCYEPLNQTGTLLLWTNPDSYSNSYGSIVITYQRPFEDIVSTTDTFDFPQNWMDAIVYGLAWRFAPDYGVPQMERSQLKADYMMLKEEALSFGTEEGSLFLMPDNYGKY